MAYLNGSHPDGLSRRIQQQLAAASNNSNHSSPFNGESYEEMDDEYYEEDGEEQIHSGSDMEGRYGEDMDDDMMDDSQQQVSQNGGDDDEEDGTMDSSEEFPVEDDDGSQISTFPSDEDDSAQLPVQQQSQRSASHHRSLVKGSHSNGTSMLSRHHNGSSNASNTNSSSHSVLAQVPAKLNTGGRSGETKLYRCPECDWLTHLAARFHAHRMTHTKTRPFKCSVCSMRSNYDWDVTKHIRQRQDRRDPAHMNAQIDIIHEDGIAIKNKQYDYCEEFAIMVPDEMAEPIKDKERRKPRLTGGNPLPVQLPPINNYSGSGDKRISSHEASPEKQLPPLLLPKPSSNNHINNRHTQNQNHHHQNNTQTGHSSAQNHHFRPPPMIQSSGLGRNHSPDYLEIESEELGENELDELLGGVEYENGPNVGMVQQQFNTINNNHIARLSHSVTQQQHSPNVPAGGSPMLTASGGRKRNKIFTCGYCGQRENSHKVMIRHICDHAGPKPFACTKCSFNTYWKESIVRHLASNHQEPIAHSYSQRYRWSINKTRSMAFTTENQPYPIERMDLSKGVHRPRSTPQLPRSANGRFLPAGSVPQLPPKPQTQSQPTQQHQPQVTLPQQSKSSEGWQKMRFSKTDNGGYQMSNDVQLKQEEKPVMGQSFDEDEDLSPNDEAFDDDLDDGNGSNSMDMNSHENSIDSAPSFNRHLSGPAGDTSAAGFKDESSMGELIGHVLNGSNGASSPANSSQRGTPVDGRLVKVYSCNQCSFRVTSVAKFHIHYVHHLNTRPYHCSACDMTSNYEWDVGKHIVKKVNQGDISHKGGTTEICHEDGLKNYEKYEGFADMIPAEEAAAYQEKRARKPKMDPYGILNSQQVPSDEFEAQLLNYANASLLSTQKSVKVEPHAPVDLVVMPDLSCYGLEGFVQPISCRYCTYKTTEEQKMINHFVAHVGVKPYKCMLCTFETNVKKRALDHVWSTHQVGPDQIEERFHVISQGQVRMIANPDGTLVEEEDPEDEEEVETKQEEEVEQQQPPVPAKDPNKLYYPELESEPNWMDNFRDEAELSGDNMVMSNGGQLKAGPGRGWRKGLGKHGPSTKKKKKPIPGLTGDLQCQYCPFKATKASHMDMHMRHHTPPQNLTNQTVFKCRECPYYVTAKRTLNKHTLMHKAAAGLIPIPAACLPPGSSYVPTVGPPKQASHTNNVLNSSTDNKEAEQEEDEDMAEENENTGVDDDEDDVEQDEEEDEADAQEEDLDDQDEDDEQEEEEENEDASSDVNESD